jgi:hypothetical protein
VEVLGREIPPELEALHDDVIAWRADAQLKFAKGMPEGSRLESRHTPDRDGNSEIRLLEDYHFGSLTHELLHTLYYRRGFPMATCIPFDTTFSTVAQLITCAVSHPALYDEAYERGLMDAYWRDKIIAGATLDAPDDPAHYEESLLMAWRLAEAVFLAPDEVKAVTEQCQAEYPNTWEVTQRLLQGMERGRALTGMGWRRGMVDLLVYFDAMAKKHHPSLQPPLEVIAVSLVLTEPQLTRPADRMIEIVTPDKSVAGLVQKQDGSLFHFRYLGPGTQRKEVVELKADLKKLRTEVFLDKYWIPYSVDVKAGATA